MTGNFLGLIKRCMVEKGCEKEDWDVESAKAGQFDGASYIGVLKDQELVGMLIWRCNVDDEIEDVTVCYMLELHVQTEARGQGIGTRLFCFLEELAVQSNQDLIMCTSYEINC